MHQLATTSAASGSGSTRELTYGKSVIEVPQVRVPHAGRWFPVFVLSMRDEDAHWYIHFVAYARYESLSVVGLSGAGSRVDDDQDGKAATEGSISPTCLSHCDTATYPRECRL